MGIEEQAVAAAELAIVAHEQAGALYAVLCGKEMDLATDKTQQWVDAIGRIMATDNPLTSKQHSASSAKEVVELDQAYREHLRTQSATVVGKMQAYVALENARLRAELARARLMATTIGNAETTGWSRRA